LANLSITTACNKNCTYCFAQAARRNAQQRFMDADVYARALEFLERSGIREVRLLGGEPTLHPRFAAYAQTALDRGFDVLVFSNGLMPEQAAQWIERAPVERVGVLAHASQPGIGEPDNSRQRTVLRRLGPKVTLSVTMEHAGATPSFALDWIRDLGLAPRIRLGIAHPSLGERTSWLRPRQYRAAGETIGRFAEECKAAGVALGFDCGFVPCMFPSDFWETAGVRPADIGCRCSPILDVLPDGGFVPCYPLASLAQESEGLEDSAQRLRLRFAERLSGLRDTGVFPECGECRWRQEKACTGGCLAAATSRVRSSTASLNRAESPPLPVSANGEPRWVVPYIDEPIEFWGHLRDEFGAWVREVYLPLPGTVLGSGRPVLPSRYGDEFLRQRPFPVNLLVNPITLPGPVREVAPRVIEELRRLIGEGPVATVTVANLQLAERIREALPALPLAASVLMDIAQPQHALLLRGICETLVPATRVMRDLPALRALRKAFPGRIRLIVNEACLPGCPHRTQHFHEMGSGVQDPHSLCDEMLEREPWLRLTGAWVLPQHLHLFGDIADEWKLAGRVTLRSPVKYRRTLAGYVHRRPLMPDQIGGGPASVLDPIEIREDFYVRTLACGRACQACKLCQDYFSRARERREYLEWSARDVRITN
jgi:MoaA/NifB/PqqE/SkfB family radical SAM enzyme